MNRHIRYEVLLAVQPFILHEVRNYFHLYLPEANRAQSKRIILATWNEVATIYKKQAIDIQNNNKTDLDIWHRNLGLCQ